MNATLSTSNVNVFISDERAYQILERVRRWEREASLNGRMAGNSELPPSVRRECQALADDAVRNAAHLIRLYSDVLADAVRHER